MEIGITLDNKLISNTIVDTKKIAFKALKCVAIITAEALVLNFATSLAAQAFAESYLSGKAIEAFTASESIKAFTKETVVKDVFNIIGNEILITGPNMQAIYQGIWNFMK